MKRPFSGNWLLTQGFGENPASYAQFGMKGHNGLDYGLPSGTPVLSPHSGKVIEASSDPTGYGNYLKIENDKEGSVLAHLQKFNVNIGDTVSEGQQVGVSDNTGNSTGPHLHWGYYLFPRNRQNGYAGFIDQAPLLPPRDSEDTITIPKSKFEELVGKSTKYDSFVSAGFNSPDDVKNKIADMQKQIDGGSTKYYNLKQAIQKTLDSN